MKIYFKNILAYSNPLDVSFPKALAFHGTSLDDRGKEALDLLEKSSSKCCFLSYDKTTTRMIIGSSTFRIRNEFKTHIETYKYSHIIIEATTLDFAEILLLLSAISTNEHVETIDFLYIEPKEYMKKSNEIYSYQDFALSDKFNDFSAVPGFTIEREEPIELVAFLGFERIRLGHLLQKDENDYNKLSPIIPLPAFVLGWENRTINNHLYYLTRESYFYNKMYYVGANNPYQSYTLLNKLSKNDKPFRIAPIGTKPNAIGCAVFLVNSLNIGSNNIDVVYDYPKKSTGRSNGIGKINIYKLILKV